MNFKSGKISNKYNLNQVFINIPFPTLCESVICETRELTKAMCHTWKKDEQKSQKINKSVTKLSSLSFKYNNNS